MTITSYHNPECGASRNVLAMIRASGEEPRIIEYLHTPPSRRELLDLTRRTGIRELPDPAGPEACPIATFTWSLLRNAMDDPAKGRRDPRVHAMGDHRRSELVPDLGYVPLPATVQERAELALAAME